MATACLSLTQRSRVNTAKVCHLLRTHMRRTWQVPAAIALVPQQQVALFWVRAQHSCQRIEEALRRLGDRSGGSRVASSVVTCHGIYIMTHIFIFTSIITKVNLSNNKKSQFETDTPPSIPTLIPRWDLEVLKPRRTLQTSKKAPPCILTALSKCKLHPLQRII